MRRLIISLCILLLAGVCTLNLADAFYYPYKLQRSDAELFYVLRNPFRGVGSGYWIYFLLTLAAILCFCLIHYKLTKKFFTVAKNKSSLAAACFFFGAIIALFCITGTRKLLPTYLLTKVPFYQLPLAQNSMHSFLYSTFRLKSSGIFDGTYLLQGPDSTELNIKHNSYPYRESLPGKNIVLFIMESVPYDYFDDKSPYRVNMPFMDSLIQHSTYYENCISYSHNSNKAITAILAGTPTLTEIPLYHSAYTAIPITHTGTLLQQQGYNSSFFIGDNYDDFGFAKCTHWLGIDEYYCKQDVPGYKKMEQHSMGLHDEYSLGFMQEKMKTMKMPFFATHFNISTHVPNDLPETYLAQNPEPAKTAQMKSMEYYSACMSDFFSVAKRQDWYQNSIFIFISDHWMYPDMDNQQNDIVQNFRIPFFIFDPQNPVGQKHPYIVSQLDVLNSVLHYSNYTGEFISYGQNLYNNPDTNRIVYAKENNIIYQAFNHDYVLGYDAVQGKPVYCYAYLQDTLRQNNLVNDNPQPIVQKLSDSMESFLRSSYKLYKKQGK